MTLIDAIKQLHELRCAEDMPIYYKPALAEVINVILMDAEPVKHGRWEFEAKWQYKNCDGRGMERKEIFGTTKRTFNRLKCSKCKKVVVIDDTIAYAYCPHCGAKMDLKGETHETD